MSASDVGTEQRFVREEPHRRSHHRPTCAALFVATRLEAAERELLISFKVVTLLSSTF